MRGTGNPQDLRTTPRHLSLAGTSRNLLPMAMALRPEAPGLFVKDEKCDLTCFFFLGKLRQRESRGQDVIRGNS